MTDQQDCQIGWPIVGAVVIQLFPADRAGVVHFEVGLEQRPAAAMRALAPPSAQDRQLRIPFRGLTRDAAAGVGRFFGLDKHVFHAGCLLWPVTLLAICENERKGGVRSLRRDVAKKLNFRRRVFRCRPFNGQLG